MGQNFLKIAISCHAVITIIMAKKLAQIFSEMMGIFSFICLFAQVNLELQVGLLVQVCIKAGAERLS